MREIYRYEEMFNFCTHKVTWPERASLSFTLGILLRADSGGLGAVDLVDVPDSPDGT